MSERADDKIGEGEIISPSPILSLAFSLIISNIKLNETKLNSKTIM